MSAGRSGTAGGLLTTAQQFGGAAGVAVIGTVYVTAATAGHGVAMARAASICAGLVVAVAALVIVHRCRVDREVAVSEARPGESPETPAPETTTGPSGLVVDTR